MSWSAWVEWVGEKEASASRASLKLMLVGWGGLARMNAAFGQVVLNSWRKRLKTAHITGACPLLLGSCDGLRRRQMRGEP